MRALDEVAQVAFKSGVILNFSCSYDRSWKFIKRWLETNVGTAIADGVARRELFRLASENRLIEDVDRWMRHHSARNLTSHTYDPNVADQVYAAAQTFAGDAQRLLVALEARND